MNNTFTIDRLLANAAAAIALFFAGALAIDGFWLATADQLYVMGVDTNSIASLQKMLGGCGLYTDIENEPFDIVQYTPIYYILSYNIARLFGVQATDVHQQIFLMRGLSVLAGVSAAMFLFFTLFRIIKTDLKFAIAAAAVFFVSGTPWFFAARPDALCTLFGVAALGTCLGAELIIRPRGVTIYLLLSIVFAFLALATKQNGSQWIFILICYLICNRKRGEAMAGLVVIAACGALTLAWFISFGPHIWTNVVNGVRNGVSLRNALFVSVYHYVAPWAFLPVVAISSLLSWPDCGQKGLRRVCAISLAVVGVLAATTCLKWGSAENYFIDVSLVSVICLGCRTSLQRMGGREEPDWACITRMFYLSIVLVVPVFAASKLDTYYYSRIDLAKHPLRPNAETTLAMYEELTLKTGGDSDASFVLSFNKPISLLYPKRGILRQAEVAGNMHERGLFSAHVFQELVRDGHIKYIIINDEQELPSHFLGAELDRYRYFGRFSNVHIYEWVK